MKYTPRVKICGITDVRALAHAAEAGADAIGIVFFAKSPRFVADLELARDIALAAGPFVSVVGLFVNPEAEQVEAVLRQVPLGLLQFHGDEDEDFCSHFRRPYIKALRMKPELDVLSAIEAYPSAQGILLDAYRPGVPGGTGETFDWGRVPNRSPKPIVLAGGLDANNVAAAINATHPWAVDVSGGVEASPGVKSAAKVEQFIHNAKSAFAKP